MEPIIIISIVIYVLLIIIFAKRMYRFLKSDVGEQEGYWCPTTYLYITPEEATKRAKRELKIMKVTLVLLVTMPIWLYFVIMFIWAAILTIGTILFCIELLAKGSGIK